MSNIIYQPQTIIYYGTKGSNLHRLTPAPDFNINIEYTYSNDTIIGYIYTITLNGNATALDLSSVNYGSSYNPETVSQDKIGGVIDHLHKIRKLLSQNGNILYVVNGSDNQTILRAKGGKLRSLNFDESSNNWTYYAPYSATIEFDSVDFGSDNDSCNTFLDPNTFTKNNDYGLVNIDKFKIKSFNDSWSFTFDENEAFERSYFLDSGSIFNMNNSSFNLSYNISAVGKHYYDYSSPNSNSTALLLPAWEQAKNFVQHRLYYQVTNLIEGIVKNTYQDACTDGEELSNLHLPGGSDGLLKDLSSYRIYNELITCEVSESDGSFSANYSSMVKTNNTDLTYGSISTKHSVKKSHSIDNSSTIPVHTMSLEGTIQGLVEGGLINSGKPIQLPDKGALFIHNNNGYTNKYDNALSVLNKIYNPLSYNGGVGLNGKRDLNPSFKQLLGITSYALGGTSSSSDPVADPPHPTSFNLTHDYFNGSINYTAEYNTNNSVCGRTYKNINIETNMPTKIIAIFNIPNSNLCAFVQDLETYTSATVNINIEGVDLSDDGQPISLNLTDLINCGSCFSTEYFPVTIPDGAIITDQTYTHNPLDGSFNASLSYICAEGCSI